MRKLLLGSSAIVAVVMSTAAFAADLPSRKAPILPPPPPPPPMWTGFYAGLNAGYGWGTGSSPQSTPAIFPGDPTNILLANVTDPFTILSGPNTLFGGLGYGGNNNVNQNGGFFGGAQVGYNYQWGSNFLIGLEADIQGTNIHGSGSITGASFSDNVTAFKQNKNGDKTANNFTTLYSVNRSLVGTANASAGVNWLGTVRGRVGYLVTPTLLVFGTGGLAYGDVYANVQNSGYGEYSLGTQKYKNGAPVDDKKNSVVGGAIAVVSPLAHTDTIKVGYSAGGGLEWMFMPNWSLKTEAIYYNLGSANVTSYSLASSGPGTLGVISATNTRFTYQGVIARAGVNYHFNWGGSAPIVAKY